MFHVVFKLNYCVNIFPNVEISFTVYRAVYVTVVTVCWSDYSVSCSCS